MTVEAIIELRETAFDSDPHNVYVNGYHRRAFYDALKAYTVDRRVCASCFAEYSLDMFRPRPDRKAVFYKGKWYSKRESICRPCEAVRVKVLQCLSTVEEI